MTVKVVFCFRRLGMADLAGVELKLNMRMLLMTVRLSVICVLIKGHFWIVCRMPVVFMVCVCVY